MCPLILTTKTTDDLPIRPLQTEGGLVRFGITTDMVFTDLFYWCNEGDFGASVTVLPESDNCTGLPDGTPCNCHHPCVDPALSYCSSSFCVGPSKNCPSNPNQCQLAKCNPKTATCDNYFRRNGTFCTVNNSEFGILNGTCQAGDCVVQIPGSYDPRRGVFNFYFIAFFFVGLTFWRLTQAFLKKGAVQWWRNIFALFPMISLLATLAVAFLHLNIVLFSPPPEITRWIYTVIFILDSPSAIFLMLAYYYRLHIVLEVGKQWNVHPMLSIVARIFLIIPLTWPIMDVLAILSIWDAEFYNMVDQRFPFMIIAIWNVFSALFTIYMHTTFVYLVIFMMSEERKAKMKTKLISLGLLLVLNPCGLLVGSTWNFWNSDVAGVIMYSTWLIEAFAFMLLNRAVAKWFKKDISKSPVRPSSPGVDGDPVVLEDTLG